MSVLFCGFAQEADKKEQKKADAARTEKDVVRALQMEDCIRHGEHAHVMLKLQKESVEEQLKKERCEERKRKQQQAKQIETSQKQSEEKEQKLHVELQRVKKMQQIRTGTQELRDLERKLRACNVGRENYLRIKENEMKVAACKERIRIEEEAAQCLRKNEEERERLKKEDAERAKYVMRLSQQQQMIEVQKRREQAYKEFVREKLMTDLVTQEMIEEDKQKELACLMKAKATKKEIDDFLRCREIWRRQLKVAMDKENHRIQKYWDSKVDHAEFEKKGKEEKMNRHMRIVEEIAAKIYAEKQQALEKEQILQNLAEIEVDKAHEDRVRAEKEAARRTRDDLKAAMCQQRRERARRLKMEQEEEMELKKAMLADLAEKERIEQLTNERRRIKMMEHRAAVDRIIAERKLRRHVEIEKMLREEEEQKELSKEEDILIEEERLKILQEHAPKLLGFMPPGIIKDGDEEKLGPEFKIAYERFHNQHLNCD